LICGPAESHRFGLAVLKCKHLDDPFELPDRCFMDGHVRGQRSDPVLGRLARGCRRRSAGLSPGSATMAGWSSTFRLDGPTGGSCARCGHRSRSRTRHCSPLKNQEIADPAVAPPMITTS